jgi:hypothetical protein
MSLNDGMGIIICALKKEKHSGLLNVLIGSLAANLCSATNTPKPLARDHQRRSKFLQTMRSITQSTLWTATSSKQ